jgi:hypothetical protein
MEPKYYKCRECDHLDRDKPAPLAYMKPYNYWCGHHKRWCYVYMEATEKECGSSYTPRREPWPERDEYI